jgi:hypothetical protein
MMESCLLGLNLFADLLHFLLLGLRSKSSLAAENLFLCKQLAFYQERRIKRCLASRPAHLTHLWLSRQANSSNISLAWTRAKRLALWCGLSAHGHPMEVSMEQSVSSKRSRKWPTLGGDLEESAREITRLPALAVPALRQRWAALFGDDPSPNLGRALLIRAIAYRLQERAFASLKPSTQRILDRIADDRSSDAPQYIPKRRASAGTVLIRQWRGVIHRVTVLDTDVVYRGKRYKSLSEVARAITGSRWSGPLFFGLKGPAREAVNC